MGVVVCLGLLVLFTEFSGYPLVLDWTVVAATLVGSAFLGLAAGVYPAWQASRIEILEVLGG